MANIHPLSNSFLPQKYQLAKTGEGWQVKINGQKIGAPSKRLSFHQKGLKVKDAQITYHGKSGGVEHEIARINHLPTFQEVRLHTKSTLFPGRYEVVITYSGPSEIQRPDKDASWRELFPSIDEPAPKAQAEVNLNDA